MSSQVPAYPISVFAVARGISDGEGIIPLGKGSEYPVWLYNDNRLYTYFDETASEGVQYTGNNLLVAVYDGNNLEVRVNGASVYTSTHAGILENLDFLFMSEEYGVSDGYYGELILYSSALQNSKVVEVEAYLMAKWGIVDRRVTARRRTDMSNDELGRPSL